MKLRKGEWSVPQGFADEGTHLSWQRNAFQPAVDPGHGWLRVAGWQLPEALQSLQEEAGDLLT